MSGKFSMDDYIDVAERIVAFNQKYPDGTLQTIDWKVAEVGDRTFIVYRAAAYRTPDDRRPGHGIAWEPFPGPTNYTKDSELMNAETAAWGRAIVACGLPANRKIASRQEVMARQGNGTQVSAPRTTAQPAQPSEAAATPNQRAAINARMGQAAVSDQEAKAILQWKCGTATLDRVSKREASKLIEELGEDGSGAPYLLGLISDAADGGDARAVAIRSRYFEQATT